MYILVACEESQAVCKEFRLKGHDAFSCDILPCSGGCPQWHIQGDVLNVLNGYCSFVTCDGVKHRVGAWDMVIAFPPCTHLAVSGARHFSIKREDGRQEEAIQFFGRIVNCLCRKVCIENPVNIISGHYVEQYYPALSWIYGFPLKHSQIIQPYYFGDPFQKRTCLWLKGLPLLEPTDILDKPENGWNNQCITNGKYGGFATKDSDGKWLRYNDPLTASIRSKTFPGIARAMAQQWG